MHSHYNKECCVVLFSQLIENKTLLIYDLHFSYIFRALRINIDTVNPTLATRDMGFCCGIVLISNMLYPVEYSQSWLREDMEFLDVYMVPPEDGDGSQEHSITTPDRWCQETAAYPNLSIINQRSIDQRPFDKEERKRWLQIVLTVYKHINLLPTRNIPHIIVP